MRLGHLNAVAITVLALSSCSGSSGASSSTSSGSSGASGMDGGSTLDAGAQDAGPTCEPVGNRAIRWDVTCNNPNNIQFIFPPDTCITVSGCSATVYAGGDVIHGTLNGTVFTGSHSPFVETTTEITADLGSNPTLTAVVSIVGYDPFTCTGTGTAPVHPSATSYCCELAGGDCAAGERCSIIASTTPPASGAPVPRFTACMPVGTVTKGGACVRTDNVLGADNCGAGLFCSPALQTAPDARTCLPTCEVTADCNAGDVCFTLVSGRPGGICVPGCTLDGNGCPAGNACRVDLSAWSAAADGGYALQFTPMCDVLGSGTRGTACTSSVDCAAGLVCGTTANGFTCEPQCSAQVPCGPNEVCTAASEFVNARGVLVTNPQGLGYCEAL